jgi:hypothetical protein
MPPATRSLDPQRRAEHKGARVVRRLPDRTQELMLGFAAGAMILVMMFLDVTLG